MINKTRILLGLLLILTSCNKKTSEIDLIKLADDDLNFHFEELIDLKEDAYTQAGYILNDREGKNRKAYVKLNIIHDGLVEEIARSDPFTSSFDSLYFVIDKSNISVFTIDNNSIKNVFDFKLDDSLFEEDRLNASYFKDYIKFKKAESPIIFASFFKDGTDISSPDLDLKDPKEFARENKETRGFFIKFSIKD